MSRRRTRLTITSDGTKDTFFFSSPTLAMSRHTFLLYAIATPICRFFFCFFRMGERGVFFVLLDVHGGSRGGPLMGRVGHCGMSTFVPSASFPARQRRRRGRRRPHRGIGELPADKQTKRMHQEKAAGLRMQNVMPPSRPWRAVRA